MRRVDIPAMLGLIVVMMAIAVAIPFDQTEKREEVERTSQKVPVKPAVELEYFDTVGVLVFGTFTNNTDRRIDKLFLECDFYGKKDGVMRVIFSKNYTVSGPIPPGGTKRLRISNGHGELWRNYSVYARVEVHR